MTATYFKNQKVRSSSAFTVGGVATDPTTVSFSVRTPAGVTTTYTYGGLGSIVAKDSVGNYHADVTGNAAGEWLVSWTGTGTCEAVCEDLFMVITYF